MSLEIGVLDQGAVQAANSHVAGCGRCRVRRDEVRGRLESLARELRAAVDDSAHVPADLLVEFTAASAGLGGEIRDAIEAHLGRCERCREAVDRAREAARHAWLSAESGARARPAGRRSAPVFRLFALPAAAAAATFVITWSVSPREKASLFAGTPVRLLGSRDVADRDNTVRLAPGAPAMLFLKLATPPEQGADYLLRLRMPSGAEETIPVSGALVDPAGTMAVAVPRDLLARPGRIEVSLVERTVGGERPVFRDAFTVE